jgi:hypothetical protein
MGTAFKIEGYISSYATKPPEVHTITLYNASRAVAMLAFRPNGAVLPANELVNGIIHLFYQFKTLLMDLTYYNGSNH